MYEITEEKICIIPGTFDPVTNGHFDVILRAYKLFDKLYVTSFDNTEKKTMFTSAERLEMLRLACEEISEIVGINQNVVNTNTKKITVDATSDLLAEYAKSKRAGFIVKGVRNMIDYEYEYSLFLINREIGNNIETVLFPAESEHLYISSTFVKEMIKYKRDISKYVPAKVNEYIRLRLNLS